MHTYVSITIVNKLHSLADDNNYVLFLLMFNNIKNL